MSEDQYGITRQAEAGGQVERIGQFVTMPSYALTSDTSVDHERKCYVVKMALTPCEPARLVWRPTALPELRK